MKATILRALVVSIAAWSAQPSLAQWQRQVIDAGGIPGQGIAISSKTSLAYVPILQQKTIAVFDGARQVSRLDLDIKPTTLGYSEATGRLFVLGMFDNAVVAIDEATGARTRIDIGPYPDKIIVDDVRGKVYVIRWGGIRAEGGVVVIDSRTLAVRDVPLGGYATGMVQDSRTGSLFVTVDGSGPGASSLVALTPEGDLLARESVDYRAYSLAVDSRNGRVYLAGLSHPPPYSADMSRFKRVFRIFSQPGLQRVSRVEWPTGPDSSKLVFMIDPTEPGLYFSSGQSTTLLHLDADGGNLQTWALPLGDVLLEDGRRVVNGIFGLDADPATGRIFVSAPVGSTIAEFDPATGATDVLSIPGAVGFNAVKFWPDSSRILVLDAADERQLTLLLRSAPAP